MKYISEVIKYEGDNHTFIFKHPCEDFNLTTQLIVHETQEAILFLNGEALDLFGPGRYTLSSENIPLLRKYINKPTDGKTPFHCEIYFINKTEQLAIKWGTDNKVEYIDPIYHFPLAIGACGEITLKVNDARKLLVKVVGTENILEQDQLISFFRGLLMNKIKPYIAKIMKEEKIHIFEIDEKLEEFSNNLKEKLAPSFNEYGIELKKFYVTNILKPENNPQYEKFKNLHFRKYNDIEEAKIEQEIGIIKQETEAKKMIIASEAMAKKREQEGYTYQQEKSFEVAKEAAGNEGSGNFTSAGIGLGIMGNIGSNVGGMITNAFEDIKEPKKNCKNCGCLLKDSDNFCPNCGKAR